MKIKKIILIAIVGLMFSCANENVKYEKPFIITYSYPSSHDASIANVAHYEAQDKNGKIISFYDMNYKYSVGDTLN